MGEKFPLTPRAKVDRKKIDSTRRAVQGGTEFFHALIRATSQAPCSGQSYVVALTDGESRSYNATMEAALAAIAGSSWTVLVVGLQVDPRTREKCEQLAKASTGGMYVHAADAG